MLDSSPTNIRFWVPVSSSSSEASCPVTPITRRTAAASRATSNPATRPVPASGKVMVVSMRTVVDFPAPLGPRTPRMRPAGTPRSTRSTATFSP